LINLFVTGGKPNFVCGKSVGNPLYKVNNSTLLINHYQIAVTLALLLKNEYHFEKRGTLKLFLTSPYWSDNKLEVPEF
jgi:hypothetical protein